MSDSAERQPLNSATRAVLVNRLPELAAQVQFRRNLAVVIGIDAYTGGIPRLTTAVNDAARLAELLADDHGYETVLLTQPATGQPVTRERLRALFEDELKARLGDDDRLLVYFAGHGVALDGDDGPRGYLVPQDARPGDSASMLAMTDLHAWLTDLPCRHMLAILDCCFAGAFRWAATRHLGALPDVIHKERYDRYLLSPAWQVLTSAAYDQKALDVIGGSVLGRREADGRQHSPFAQALIDALEKGAADLVPKGQGDGVITATELYLYLREQVEVQAEAQAGHEQTPGLWPLNKHRKGEFIFLAPGHPLNLPPAPDLTDELNPYRGLKSYDQQHAPLFFGREDEIKELVALVEQQPFLAVLGASGTGKSSLVKAGVLPRLDVRSDDFSRPALAEATEVATTNEAYRVLPPMRPTDHPVQALDALLRAELGEDPSGFPNPKGLSDDNALAQTIARWAEGHPNERLVLTIDQFEELATLCRDDAERDRFLRLLAEAVRQHPVAFRLIITLRTDFEPQFTQEGSPLANLWQSARLAKPPARYIVPPMEIEDLRQVIEGPAAVRVLYFDPPELVDDLIKEVIQTPGALPLLSFTLSELYVKYVQSGRDDRALSGADYKALGGVVGSLRNRASEEYDILPDDAHRLTMQRVMLRMVAVEGGELARRRVALSELEYPTAEENARVQTVLDRLVEARLLVRGTSDPSPGSGQVLNGTEGDPYAEPAHDALVLAWDMLLRWKKEADEYLPLQRRLAQAASEWSKAKPEARAGLLWENNPRLDQAKDMLWPTDARQEGLIGRLSWEWQVLFPQFEDRVKVSWLNQAEERFIRESVNGRARFRQRVLGTVAAFVFLLMIATGISLLLQDRAVRAEVVAKANEGRAIAAEATAVTNEQIAKKNEATAISAQATAVAERNIADARRLALESGVALEVNQPRSLLLAVEAQKISNETGLYVRSAEQALLDALAAPSSIALRGGPAATQLALYGRSGRWIAAGGADGKVYLWDILKPDAPPVLSGSHTHAIAWAGFSADDKWLVTADKESVRAWPIDRAGQSSVTLYQVSEADRAKYVEITAMVVSPDGLRAAVGVNDGRVWAWTVAPFSTQWSFPLNGFPDPATVLAFSADGRLLFANRGANAVIHDLEHLGDELRLRPHPNRVMSGAFSPAKADKSLVTTDQFGSVFLWPGDSLFDSETNRLKQGDIQATQLRRPAESGGMAQNPAFDPQGHWVAVSTADGTIHLWDVEKGGPLGVLIRKAFPDLAEEGKYPSHALIGHRSPVLDIVFSSDGNTLASSSIDGSVGVWNLESLIAAKHYLRVDVTDGAMKFVGIEAVQPKVLRGAVGDVGTVAIDPTGSLLLTADSAGPARLWQLRHLSALPTEVTRLNRAAPLVSCGADRWVVQNQSADGQTEIKVFQPDTVALTDIKGLPAVDGSALCVSTPSWIAISDKQGQIQLWAATATGWEPRAPLTTGPHKNLAFSHNARWLAAAGDDGKVSVWDMADVTRQPQVLASQQQRIDSLVFSPDDRWLATGGYFPEGDKVLRNGFRLWDITSLPTGIISPTAPTRQFVSVDQLIFSSDSRYLQTRDSGCRSCRRIWDVGNPQEAEVKFEASQVFVGADGGWWATRSQDNMLYLWNVDQRTGAERTVPVALRFDDISGATALSRDGKRFAVGTRSGRVYVWDLQHPAEPFVLHGISDNRIRHVFFGEREQIIAATDDGTLARWPLDERELVALACRYAGRNLAAQEWQVAFPAPRDYQATCSDWPEATSVR